MHRVIEKLTKREVECLTLMSNGHNTHDTAKLMSITYASVRQYQQQIYRKLEVNSAVEAVARALREGIIE